MALPVSLANATATLNLPISGTTTDTFGNVIPNTEEIEITLYLRRGTLTPRDLEGAGVTPVSDVMEGYVLEALDSRVKPGVRGTIIFSSDAETDCEVVEARFPYGNTGLIGETLTNVLGDKIRIVRYGQR